MAYAPGTQPDAPTIGGSGFAVNGMRGESNNYMLDGINNNDMTDNSIRPASALFRRKPSRSSGWSRITSTSSMEGTRAVSSMSS